METVYLDSGSSELLGVPTSDASGEMDGRFLTFWIDGQLFGIPIAHVVQIVGIQPITPLPELDNCVKGVINLRGSLIPLIDMRLRFGKEEVPYQERSCIIVTSMEAVQIGLIVEAVNEVTYIDEENISPPPGLCAAQKTGAYLSGLAKQGSSIVLLLDAQKLLSEELFRCVKSCL